MTVVCSGFILQEASRLGFSLEEEDFTPKGVLQRATVEVCRAKHSLEVLGSSSSSLPAQELGAMNLVGAKFQTEKRQDVEVHVKKVLWAQQLHTAWRTSGQHLEGDPFGICLAQS